MATNSTVPPFPPPLRGRARVGGSRSGTARRRSQGEGGTARVDPLPQPLPARAGLSHVQEHIDEETVVPGGAFEFASQRGLCIGMSTSDIEGKSPQNDEGGGSAAFYASPLILVANAIEHPVPVAFERPMLA